MKDFVVGAVVGSVIGAAAALMLAPKPGKELRGDVALQAVSLKDKGVSLSTTAKEKTVELSHQLKDQSTQLVEKVKAKTTKGPGVLDDGTASAEGEEPLETVKELVEDVKETAVEAKDTVVQAATDTVETVKEEIDEAKSDAAHAEVAEVASAEVDDVLKKAELEAEGQPENVDPDLNK